MVLQAIQQLKKTNNNMTTSTPNDYITIKETTSIGLHRRNGNNNDDDSSRSSSPHQLDELAASAFMIRNKVSTQQHQPPNKTMAAAADNDVLPKSTGCGGSSDAATITNQPNVLQGTNYSRSLHSSSSAHTRRRENDDDDDDDDDDYHPPSSSSHKQQQQHTDNNNKTKNNSTESDTYVYRDYAQEEDPMEKIAHTYANHSSLITHEDETTRNLACQKLPAKLAAMLSDPGKRERGKVGLILFVLILFVCLSGRVCLLVCVYIILYIMWSFVFDTTLERNRERERVCVCGR
jgi:hypothetical protein